MAHLNDQRDAQDLPPVLRSYLRRFERRRRWLSLLLAGGWTLASITLWAMLWCAMDRLLALPAGVRAAALLANLPLGAMLLARPLVHLLRRLDPLATAQDAERCDRSLGQRLATVVTQWQLPAALRASAQLTAALASELQQHLPSRPPRRSLPARRAMRSWIFAAVALAMMLAAARLPWLDLPDLLARYVDPFAAGPPVTTTRLDVVAPNQEIVQGQSARIRVRARFLEDHPVWLHTSADGQYWTHTVLAATAGGDQYTLVTGALDTDLVYYITANDARTPLCRLRVLHVPAVREFRIHYHYPGYVAHADMDLRNADGLVQAPAGTQTTMRIVSTQPLWEATVHVDNRTIAAQPTQDPHEVSVVLPVVRDGPIGIELVSDRGAVGHGPASARVRVLRDRPPVVRLMGPASDLTSRPLDRLAIEFDAADDFGLESLALRWRIAGQPTSHDLPLRVIGDDPLRQQRRLSLDLSAWPLRPGDTLFLTVVARDGAAHAQASQWRRIAIVPQSLSIHQRQMHIELLRAWQAAIRLLDPVQPGAALDAATNPAPAPPDAPALPDAFTPLAQCLLRAIANTDDPAMARTLATMVDAAESIRSPAQASGARPASQPATFPSSSRPDVRQPTPDRRQQTLALAARIAVLARGCIASAMQIDHANVQFMQRSAVAVPGAIRADLQANAALLGMNADDAHLAESLQSLVDARQRLVNAAQPVDFALAARDWAAHPAASASALLAARLRAGAAAETLGPSPAWQRADDLLLAASAVQQPDAIPSCASLADAIAVACAPDAMADGRALERARQTLASPRPRAGTDRSKTAETLDRDLLDSCAAMARRQYQRVTELDQRVADSLLRARPQTSTGGLAGLRPSQADLWAAVRRWSDYAQQLDRLEEQQSLLAQRTRAADTRQAAALAADQRSIARQISALAIEPGAPPPVGDAPSTRPSTRPSSRSASPRATIPPRIWAEADAELPHPQRDLAEALHQADTLASSMASAASTQPAGLDAVAAQQREILAILNEARRRAGYRAARARLRASPTFAALLAPRVWGDEDSLSGASPGLAAAPPGIAFSAWDLLRQWGRSLPWSIQDAIEPDNAFESAGFEPALRAYFNVIGK